MPGYFWKSGFIPPELQRKIETIIKHTRKGQLGTSPLEEAKKFTEEARQIMSGSQAEKDSKNKIIIKDIK